MPSHYKLTKVRLTVQKRLLLSWENKHLFGFFHFFRYLPEFLDPKCYTWLESYGGEVSHGKKLKIFGVTIWLTEFCQHFGIQIITPADTLSYVYWSQEKVTGTADAH